MGRTLKILAGLILASCVGGCLAPGYLPSDGAYDSPWTGGYAMVYDAAVVAQGWPLPVLILAEDFDKGVPFNIVTSIAMPVALCVMVVFGTIALPFVLAIDALQSAWDPGLPPRHRALLPAGRNPPSRWYT